MGVRINGRWFPNMQAVTDYLWLLTQWNLKLLGAGIRPISDALHNGELKYFRHHVGNLRVWNVEQIWENGGGQCGDLAPAVAAESIAAGRLAYPVLYKSGTPGVVHVVVQDHETGRWLDPSRTGGMGGCSTMYLPGVA